MRVCSRWFCVWCSGSLWVFGFGDCCVVSGLVVLQWLICFWLPHCWVWVVQCGWRVWVAWVSVFGAGYC